MKWYNRRVEQIQVVELDKAKKRVGAKLKTIEKTFGRKLDAHKKKYEYGKKGHPY
jgi:hypothetical protein